jgi:hypothetical protein
VFPPNDATFSGGIVDGISGVQMGPGRIAVDAYPLIPNSCARLAESRRWPPWSYGARAERLKHRVRAGGHHVPDDKIRKRQRRLWTLVAEAITACDIATVYDNGRLTGPRIVAQLSGGEIVGSVSWSAWTSQALASRWPS